jgi:hypothetical protein
MQAAYPAHSLCGTVPTVEVLCCAVQALQLDLAQQSASTVGPQGNRFLEVQDQRHVTRGDDPTPSPSDCRTTEGLAAGTICM